jgi:hypothetical protein
MGSRLSVQKNGGFPSTICAEHAEPSWTSQLGNVNKTARIYMCYAAKLSTSISRTVFPQMPAFEVSNRNSFWKKAS